MAARARAASNSAKAIDNMKRDLQALKEDFVSLSRQIEGLANNAPEDVIAEMKARLEQFREGFDGVIAEAGERGRDAVDAMSSAGASVIDNVEESIRERPLTSLALALGVGYMLSALRR